jgi:hypothetical protein
MRTPKTFLIVAGILFSGCGHHREIADFGTELYRATSDATNAIDRIPSAAGVTEAFKDFKKAQIRLDEKWNRFLSTRLTEEDRRGIGVVVAPSREKLSECFNKHSSEWSDPEFYASMELFLNDFKSHFNPDDIHE